MVQLIKWVDNLSYVHFCYFPNRTVWPWPTSNKTKNKTQQQHAHAHTHWLVGDLIFDEYTDSDIVMRLVANSIRWQIDTMYCVYKYMDDT